jgi:hypothetical protein
MMLEVENDYHNVLKQSSSNGHNDDNNDNEYDNDGKFAMIRQQRKQLRFEIKQKQAIRSRLLFLYQCDLLPSVQQ